MELSLSKKNEAKKLKATTNELVFADLLSIGYSEEDAYTIAYPGDAMLSLQVQKGNRKDITGKAGFKQLCETRRVKNSSYLSVPSNTEELELIDSDEVAKEILLSAKKQPVGSKERAELFAKYNEIRTKNEQIAEEATDAIQFYLPIKCHQCPLFFAYNEFRKEQEIKEIRPVEMEHIIRAAHRIISEAMEEESGD